MNFRILFYTLIMFTSICAQIEKDSKKTFRFAISDQVLFEINVNDAKMALTFLVDKYVESEEIDYNSEMNMFSDLDKLILNHSEKPFEIIFLLSSQYLYLRNKIELTPFVASSRRDNPFTSYVIVVKKDSGVNNLKDLLSKKVDYYSNPKLEFSITLKLLKRLCDIEFNKPPDKAFTTIEPRENAQTALLNVFFEKIDVCLIEKYHYEIISELNPQIKKQTKVLYESEEFITGLACFTPYSREKELFLEKTVTMHETVYGKQFMDVFKIGRVFRITKEDLKTLEVLFEDSKLISNKLAK